MTKIEKIGENSRYYLSDSAHFLGPYVEFHENSENDVKNEIRLKEIKGGGGSLVGMKVGEKLIMPRERAEKIR